jgi:hypothetical protein
VSPGFAALADELHFKRTKDCIGTHLRDGMGDHPSKYRRIGCELLQAPAAQTACARILL